MRYITHSRCTIFVDFFTTLELLYRFSDASFQPFFHIYAFQYRTNSYHPTHINRAEDGLEFWAATVATASVSVMKSPDTLRKKP